MTLIVEDGTGLPNAESLVSVAEADTYHNRRGNTLWLNLSLAEKERHLRLANDYLIQQYRRRWKGYVVATDQACDWPRIGVYLHDRNQVVDFDEIPVPVKNAAAELAYRSMSQTLNPDQSQKVVREKVGPMEVEYDPYSPSKVAFSAVEQYLAPYLRESGSGPNVKLTRG